MKAKKFLVIFTVAVLFFNSARILYGHYKTPQGSPVLIEGIESFTPTLESVDVLSIATPDTFSTQVAPTNPLINEYVIKNKVDLSSGVPVQMIVCTVSGKCLPSTWASPVSASAGEPSEVFDPKNGTTYIYNGHDYGQGFGNMPIWFAHSSSVGSKELFGANLEYFLRIKEIGVSTYTTEEAVNLFNLEIIGSEITVCQDETKEKLSAASMNLECLGETVKLRVTGGVLILGDDVDEFMVHTMDMHDYLMKKYPSAGFDSVTSKTGLLYVICLGRLSDQPNVGGNRFDENRAVISAQVIP